MRFIKALNANEYTPSLYEYVRSQCYKPTFMDTIPGQVKTESELIAAIMRMQRSLAESELYICAGEAVLPALEAPNDIVVPAVARMPAQGL